MTTMLQQAAKALTETAILKPGRRLWELNEKDVMLRLSKSEKAIAGIYLILHDYAEGRFPPTFNDQQKAYDAEIAARFSLAGVTDSYITDRRMRKPFWLGQPIEQYLTDFVEIVRAFERLGIHPPQKILELGCGTGWMAEFLALTGFEVVGTTISPYDVDDAKTRVKSIEAKNLKVDLDFIAAPMESVSEAVQEIAPFDGVFVYEALHHAYDWRKAIEESYSCLKPGGWLVVCNEPNVVHTWVSYRQARLTNTHEIGFKRADLIKCLKQTGFTKIRLLKNWTNYFVKAHWIAAQK